MIWQETLELNELVREEEHRAQAARLIQQAKDQEGFIRAMDAYVDG